MVTGTQDFVKTGFGTPQFALVFVNRAVADGTAADHAVLCMGTTDGVRQRVASTSSPHADNAGNQWSMCKNDKLIVLLDPTVGSTIDCEAGFTSWIADGMRINWTTALLRAIWLPSCYVAASRMPM